MPFTFKLAKRLALSKAVRATAARALSALRQVSTNPALAVPASPASNHVVAERTTSLVGLFVVSQTRVLRRTVS